MNCLGPLDGKEFKDVKIIATFRLASIANPPSDMLSDLHEAIAYSNHRLMYKHKLMYTDIIPYYKYDTTDIIEFSILLVPLSDWSGDIPSAMDLSQISRYLLSHYPDKYRVLIAKQNGTRFLTLILR